MHKKSSQCIILLHVIPSIVGSHSQCAVCKRRGPKLVVVPACARSQLFLDKLTFLPVWAKCCPGHLSDNYFHNHAVEQISPTRTTSNINHSGLMELLTEIRDIASSGNQWRIDFDNRNSVWNNSERNLKRLLHLKCTHMSKVISYKVKVWNAKQNSMYFV